MGFLLTTQKQYQVIGTTALAASADNAPAVGARLNSSWWSTYADNAIKLSPLTNGIVLKASGGVADETFSTQIWGIAEKGDMELICELDWIIGTQVATNGQLYCDQCALVATKGTVDATVPNTGANEMVAIATMDGIGYEQIVALFTTKHANKPAATVYCRTY